MNCWTWMLATFVWIIVWGLICIHELQINSFEMARKEWGWVLACLFWPVWIIAILVGRFVMLLVAREKL